jgi:hypothetical protein
MNTLCSFRCIPSICKFLLVMLILCELLLGSVRPAYAADQIDIAAPPGSGEFGYSVTVLPNGNFVVTDPYFNGGIAVGAGAVYLYNGATHAIISTLTGSSIGNHIGIHGVTVLSNGNYVIKSPYWDNGTATEAGAVTWGDQYTGVSGVISSANSLVGTMTDSRVGSGGVVPLKNGNYVVISPEWDNPILPDAGAATWGRGDTGIHGAVTGSNSLIGANAGDRVGSNGVLALTNGNYVVCSSYWNNGGISDAGAATWGDGHSGTTTGLVSTSNSMVGNSANDSVGSRCLALSNGNYVVGSPDWNNGAIVDAGAVSWGNGETGTMGPLSSANSLVGGKDNDKVGYMFNALTNGHYVVSSPYWDNGGFINAGAATWGNGGSGVTGLISAINSLVGSKTNDYVSIYGMQALSNGNYVVLSPWWNNGAIIDAGAATWGNGNSGTSGVVSTANSLVGSQNDDQVSRSAAPLKNGNYVVYSPYWDKGLVSNAGAATWMSGGSSFAGTVSTSNSLVGSKADDQIGSSGGAALGNGNYLVFSPLWDNGSVTDAGAVTWGNGVSGTTGSVTPGNSLVGGQANDKVGNNYVVALTNGNYVVPSPKWNNVAINTAGAATWGNGATGVVGLVSSANSLVGTSTNDNVGSQYVALNNGDYVVFSPQWDSSGGTTDAGAVTWGWGAGGTTGSITQHNSVVGTTTNGGFTINYAYDAINQQLVIGRPADNIVTLFQLHHLYMPQIRR